MQSIQEVKGNCRLVEGDDGKTHWVWAGAEVRGSPRMRAPDYTLDPTGATMATQHGRRAVWHVVNRKPLPLGHNVFSTCATALCVNPACVDSGTPKDRGQAITQRGIFKHNPRRRLANRRNSDKQRKVTPELAHMIQTSSDTNEMLAARLNVCSRTITRVRTGASKASGNPFQGLFR